MYCCPFIIRGRQSSFWPLGKICTSHLATGCTAHAFITTVSTTTNLLESTYDWSIAINRWLSVGIIYTDFTKAFDSVIHSKLLFKHQLLVIPDLLNSWICLFLSNHHQCVVVENCFSSLILVTSGVPQGSVIRRLLFIIYINDLLSLPSANVSIKLYIND